MICHHYFPFEFKFYIIVFQIPNILTKSCRVSFAAVSKTAQMTIESCFECVLSKPYISLCFLGVKSCHLFWHCGILSINNRNTAPESIRFRRNTLPHNWPGEKDNNPSQIIHTFQSKHTLVQKSQPRFWHYNGKLRWCGNLRTTRPIPAVAITTPRVKHRIIQRRRISLLQHIPQTDRDNQERHVQDFQRQ